SPPASAAVAAAPAIGPFATLLFSRTEMTAADGCTPDDRNIARLDTTVAPYLHSLGMTGVGSLETGVVKQSVDKCVHYSSTMMGSWDEAQALADDGWSFVSHTATYPMDVDLPPERADAETCGSANTIEAHGLPGAHGMIAYPGDLAQPTQLQTEYGAKCFAWGRWYGNHGITTVSDATKPPFWQHIAGAGGGPCNDSTKACYRRSMVSGSKHYTLPGDLIDDVHLLGPGRWFTLQAFVLVKGKSPAYSTSKVAWDCTSPNPVLHWTNDNERYCLTDFEQVLQALAAVPGIIVTDPLTVGIAMGRPADYPRSALGSDTEPPTTPGHFVAATVPPDPEVSLTWTASSDDTGVAGYRLERSTDQTHWTVLAASLGSLRYDDASTAPDTRYHYRLRALDFAGNASPYAFASVTTPPPSGTVQFVTNSGFESGSTTGWTGYNRTSRVTAVRPAGGSEDGLWAGKARNSLSAPSTTGIVSVKPHWVSSTHAGRTYTAAGWLSGPAGTTVTVQLRECNASGTSCPGVGRVHVALPASGWVHASVPFAAVRDGDALKFSAYGRLPAGASLLVDDLTITAPR
ncbi:MAG: hypothetical protein WB797_14570, partial [Nocardioides sp.]